MSLRKTALIVVLMTFLGLTLVLVSSLRSILFSQFNYQEQQNVLADLQIVQNEFERLSADQVTSAKSFLDDEFSSGFDPESFQWQSPSLKIAWRELSVDWIAIVDRDGHQYSVQLNDQKTLSPSPVELINAIADEANTALWQNAEPQTGILNVSGRLFFLAAIPVPDHPGYVFITGRWISNSDLVRFSALLRRSIRLSPYREDLQSSLQADSLASITTERPFTFLNLNKQTIGGIYLVTDLYSNPAFVLTFDQPRSLYRTGQILYIYMLIALVSTTLIFAVITLLLIDRVFVSRLLQLNRQVKEIGSSHDISRRVSAGRTDEISDLGAGINQMLEQLQASQRRLVEIEEEERRHIALELHDEIGQMLTGLKILLETMPEMTTAAAAERHKQALEYSNELIQRVRNLSLDLRPALLDDLGLIPALQRLFDRMKRQTGLQVEFHHDHLSDTRFAPALEIAGYRIVQEAITNVIRHSGSTQASVQVWANDTTLSIQVEDHGRGFNLADASFIEKSSGLTGMHERVTLLGGKLTIDTSPGRGVLLLAEIPLNQRTN